MNKTKIEWCDMTWNPVTGCYHGCNYCYANRIINRFGGSDIRVEHNAIHVLDSKYYDIYDSVHTDYSHESNTVFRPYPFGFEPTFHRYRLDEPQHYKKSARIFVSSMGDLFGEWVPDEWIVEVFKACEAAPQHTYLFLTKNAKRYTDIINSGLIQPKDNYWFGTTATTSDGEVISRGQGINTFVSIEPLLERFGPCKHLDELPNWVIIGGETGNKKDKVIPEKEWIDEIVNDCDCAGIPVFMKDSLIPIVGEENMRREFPEGLML